jgi:glycosyltransferase involved in cell wall biosynthesis
VRVGVDGRSLRATADARGIGRYLHSLLPALTNAGGDDRYAILVPGKRGPEAERIEGLPRIAVHSTRIGSRPLFGLAALTGRPRLDRMLGDCDVVWAPAVAPLAVSSRVPLVLTVPDLSFEHRASDYSAYERAWHRLARARRLASRADRVVALSEAVRREIIGEWGLDPSKVVTVAPGPGRLRPSRGTQRRVSLEPGYVLAVGALEPRKCPELLVEAHARARGLGLEAELVFAGDGPLREHVAGQGATVLGHVPDEQLDRLYRDALALACVSREEGFAFTPLEALALGTPAVVTDLPVFAETLGTGALRVPVGDTAALADALLRLERDERLRTELVRTGRATAERLSWDRAGARMRTVLAEAAECRR